MSASDSWFKVGSWTYMNESCRNNDSCTELLDDGEQYARCAYMKQALEKHGSIDSYFELAVIRPNIVWNAHQLHYQPTWGRSARCEARCCSLDPSCHRSMPPMIRRHSVCK
jgi:hypothetical protein